MSDNTTDSITIQSVIIEVKDDKLSSEIANGVSDIDIFEHLDKPYLTAMLAYTDRDNIVSKFDISGGEKVRLTLKSNRDNTVSVSKTFFIDKVVLSDKSTDISEMYVFHLIEDIGYLSNLHNLNRSYSGKPSEIIERISKEYFSKNINQVSKDFQSMKVIVPNLSPVDTMCWIKNRASTSDGYPYYLYSTLVGKDIQLRDLKSLMSAPPVNAVDHPYTFSESEFSMTKNPPERRERFIVRYQSKGTENLFKLIRDGLVGSDYRYINVTKNKVDQFTFNIDEEVIKSLKKENIINKGTPLFDNDRYAETTADIKSRRISQIGGTSAHPNNKSYSESEGVAQYRLNIINRAMTHMLTKSKIDFVLEGIEFLDGDENSTLGRKISLRFLRNKLDENAEGVYDTKKSGDFLIFACKHSISRSSYFVTMSGVKLSNGEVI